MGSEVEAASNIAGSQSLSTKTGTFQAFVQGRYYLLGAQT